MKTRNEMPEGMPFNPYVDRQNELMRSRRTLQEMKKREAELQGRMITKKAGHTLITGLPESVAMITPHINT